MYKKIIFIIFILGMNMYPSFGDTSDLPIQIAKARTACAGISDAIAHLKKMAGINTAITAVGTVAGGVALGTGIAKANVDEKAEQLEAELQAEIDKLNKLAATQTHIDIIPDFDLDEDGNVIPSVPPHTDSQSELEKKQAELAQLTQKSKTLGNVRTGTLAGAAVTDVAGTIIAVKNRVDDELQQRIDECALSVQELSKTHVQAKLQKEDQTLLTQAKNIIDGCNEWRTIDLSTINKRATGAAISSGVGAAMAIAGTATSASANSDRIRNDNSEQGLKGAMKKGDREPLNMQNAWDMGSALVRENTSKRITTFADVQTKTEQEAYQKASQEMKKIYPDATSISCTGNCNSRPGTDDIVICTDSSTNRRLEFVFDDICNKKSSSVTSSVGNTYSDPGMYVRPGMR